MKSDVILLAGGLGTRLKNVLKDVPKPMAPVNNRPFLAYLLSYLKAQNCKKVILSVGHLSESIFNYFGNNFEGLKLVYSIESAPLGTGGAINLALQHVETENAFILNGDTYFNIPLDEMEAQHQVNGNEITIAVKNMTNFDRYGALNIKDDRIIAFEEKKALASGIINAGTYLLRKHDFTKITWPQKFSFEKDFLEEYATKFTMKPFYSDNYFIDIGIPEDYNKVQSDFKTMFS